MLARHERVSLVVFEVPRRGKEGGFLAPPQKIEKAAAALTGHIYSSACTLPPKYLHSDRYFLAIRQDEVVVRRDTRNRH